MNRSIYLVACVALFAGCSGNSETHTPEELALQEKLIGTWNATDGSGTVLSFDKDWRITESSINTGGGWLLGNEQHREGKVKYDIDGDGTTIEETGKHLPLLLEFDSTIETDQATSAWAIESIEDEEMTLWARIGEGEFRRMPLVRIGEPHEVKQEGSDASGK